MRRLHLIQEAVVSSAIAAAAGGAASGGFISDRLGRLWALLIADALFGIGGVIMAAAPAVAVLIAGQVQSWPFWLFAV